VGWLERHEHGLGMSSSPIDIGATLRQRLFERGGPVVLTSASLTTKGSFGFMRSRVGLDEPGAAPLEELSVTPALDYRNQALLYLPADLPDVNEGTFTDAAVGRVSELCRLPRGGAFVLCTSLRAMHAFATGLRVLGLSPLVQGQAPKRALLDAFRRDGCALLVATMSFWEGVDVPGEALSLVVIDRIPFAVPSDPLVAARCRALEQKGEPAFSRYSLPQAALLLKQGFGRLLRTRSDRGVVAILDRRILEKSYGTTLIESLPEVRTTSVLDEVAGFFATRFTA
jgi:ATP-dependent DNA helicase DinG